MKTYANHKVNSGIVAYEIAASSIDIQFVDGSVYRYTYTSAGKANIDHMKLLAINGSGLSTFVTTNVRNDYAAKLSNPR